MKKPNLFWSTMVIIVLSYVGEYYYTVNSIKHNLKECKLVAMTDLVAPHKTSTVIDKLMVEQEESLKGIDATSSRKRKVLSAYRSILENECTGG
jgi:uncharacterized protein YcbK (DUF882 family)